MFKKILVPVVVGILLLGSTAMSFAKCCGSCGCGCGCGCDGGACSGDQKTSCECCE